MKKVYSYLATYLVIASGFCSYSFESIDPYDGRSRFVLTPEFVYLKRVAKIQDQCLSRVEDDVGSHGMAYGYDYPVIPSSCTPGRCMITTKDLLHKQDFAPGLALTLDYLYNKRTTLQARYMGLFDWKASKSAECPDSLSFPFHDDVNDTFDYQDANKMKASNDSKFWSIEANAWNHITKRRVLPFSFSWLFGLRYLDFKEDFNLLSCTDWGCSNYKIDVKNRMGVVQLGGDFHGALGDNFWWGIFIKGGLLVNFAENHTVFRDDDNTITLKSYNPSDFNAAFMGELAPFFYFNLFKNVIFKFSYEGFIISNLALAMNQISYREQDAEVERRVNTGGVLLLHGLFMGFSFVF